MFVTILSPHLHGARTMHEDTMARDEGVVIEWAPFRLRDGVTDAELMEASAAIQRDFLEARPGFVRRELVRSGDGLWADVVYWTDLAAARDAMDAAASSTTCSRYFHLMVGASGAPDPGDGVTHLRLVRP